MVIRVFALKLQIYVAGGTRNSAEAVNNLIRVLDEDFEDQYSLEIIDLMKSPQLAAKEKIFATPTVIKYSPGTPRRIIGDLSDKEKVLRGLGLMSDSRQ